MVRAHSASVLRAAGVKHQRNSPRLWLSLFQHARADEGQRVTRGRRGLSRTAGRGSRRGTRVCLRGSMLSLLLTDLKWIPRGRVIQVNHVSLSSRAGIPKLCHVKDPSTGRRPQFDKVLSARFPSGGSFSRFSWDNVWKTWPVSLGLTWMELLTLCWTQLGSESRWIRLSLNSLEQQNFKQKFARS